ncbi:MAG: RagB/SusD family nutrient uptake outer membrane protein [Saprospiraceae bacterium]
MRTIKKYTAFFAVLILAHAFSACEKDFTNPGAATETQVLNSADGLIGLTVGIQKRWSVGRQSPLYATVAGSGFSTFELRLINPGNLAENEVAIGKGTLLPSNGITANIWEECLLVRNESDKVLANASKVPDAGVRSGLIAMASIFKALANGTLAQFYEQIPLETGDNARFSPRTEALQDAVATLEAAKAVVTATPVSAAFKAKTPASIDALNTINALLARYNNMLGNHDAAISAAGAVDLSSKSTFVFDAVNTNPIAFVSILTNNVYQPVDLTLGLPPALQRVNDLRLEFYFEDLMPMNNDFRAAGFFNSATAAIPVYVPGEMLLIRAEAYARKDMLNEAKTELDKVLHKEDSDDVFGIGADDTGYSGPLTKEAILEAIYTNRCYEMMMSGMRLEDSRRFGRPGPNEPNEERNRNFYPYPNSERNNNVNTPPDPAI